MDDGYPTGIAADFFGSAWSGTAHGAQYAAGQRVASQSCQEFPAACIDGNIACAKDDVGGIACYVFLLAKQGKGLVTGVERDADDFRTLGNEDASFGVYAVAQLSFGQGSEHFYSGVFEGGDFYYRHVDLFFPAKVKKEYRPEQRFFLYLCP